MSEHSIYFYEIHVQFTTYKVHGGTFRGSNSAMFFVSSLVNGGQLLSLLHSERPKLYAILAFLSAVELPGRVAQSEGHLTRKSGVLGSIPGLATYFRFSFRFFKKGRCQLLAKVCARSTG